MTSHKLDESLMYEPFCVLLNNRFLVEQCFVIQWLREQYRIKFHMKNKYIINANFA